MTPEGRQDQTRLQTRQYRMPSPQPSLQARPETQSTPEPPRPTAQLRGRLTIFLGAWPGVGTTTALLQAAHQVQAKAAIVQHLRLEEQLGAQVANIAGRSMSAEVLAWARTHNVTRILLGKPTHARWRDVVFGSLLPEVVRGSGTMEVHALAGDFSPPLQASAPPGRPWSWRPYAWAVASVGATTLLGSVLQGRVEIAEIIMIYLLGIGIVAASLDRGPAILASALSVAAFDYFLVPPRFTFVV